MTGGGTVAVYSDITELKQRETQLQEANRRTREAAEEIGRKHRELEALSSKLAKYLSPQVYASIFEGRQEVKLASQRKKLTVFFSDIAGFTETTDRMESEDVTHLLNQYLTEMSRVALHYGATIDKYVGDAIMIFFGDPETRGVKADAFACVEMAIAMQKRMRELAAHWRDTGVERPFSCRIGIHTGYCTVGNFGSEDRMDYTIIGGAVNLASRLEHEAPEGGILISYETYAHVKDEIRCEEMGRLRVRGIGHPVATFRVVGRHANFADGTARIRSELHHLRLDVDPELMTAEERRRAAALLQEALMRVGPTPVEPQAPKAVTTTDPTPPASTGAQRLAPPRQAYTPLVAVTSAAQGAPMAGPTNMTLGGQPGQGLGGARFFVPEGIPSARLPLQMRRQSAYILSCRPRSTMAIDAARNRRSGPGGSSRRLHQIPLAGVTMGANQARRA